MCSSVNISLKRFSLQKRNHLQVLYHDLQFCPQLFPGGAINLLLVKNYNWDRMPPWLNELCQVTDIKIISDV